MFSVVGTTQRMLLWKPTTWLAAVALLLALSAGWTLARPAVAVAAEDVQLQVKNGVLFRAGVPFDGVVQERYANGQRKRVTPYRLGMREGLMRAWHANGTVAEERNYELGREHGTHRGWHEDGARRFEFHYVRGVANGAMREWYPDGKPYTQFEYADGHESGRQRMWTGDGVLRANYVVEGGRRFGLMGTAGCTGAHEYTP